LRRPARPNGDQILWSGKFGDLRNAKQRLLIAVPITLLLIMVLLYGLFNSWRSRMASVAGCSGRLQPSWSAACS
jgi:heavy metal efflux system protein